jgi:chromosomal replication initiation ATPase DnaA
MADLTAIPTAHLVAELARRFAPPTEAPLHLITLGEIVAAAWAIAPTELPGPSRTERIAAARIQYCAAARQHIPTATLAEIGATIKRDHTTVIHATKRHPQLLASDEHYRRAWNIIQSRIPS